MSAKIHTLPIRHTFAYPLKRILSLLFVCIASACADEKIASRGYPVVNTYEVSDISEAGVTLKGEILDVGNGVSDHGFIYSSYSVTDANEGAGTNKISLGPVEDRGPFSTFANTDLIVGQLYHVRAFAVAKGSGKLVLGQEYQFTSLGGAAPTIRDFYPKEASIGDTITMVGSGFSNVPVNNNVFFGTTRSPVKKAQGDTLQIFVPLTLPAGNTSLSVVVGQKTVEAKDKFNLLKVTPGSFEEHMVAIGDTITLHGENFPLVPTSISISMLGIQGIIVSLQRDNIKVRVRNEAEVKSSLISLTAGTQNLQFADSIKILPPTITNFTPIAGSSDTEIIITGDNFNPLAKRNIVKLGDNIITVDEATRKSIKARVTSGITPGKYDLSVSTLGQTVKSNVQFEIVKPEIFTIEPLNGTWRTLVTIKGKNFNDDAAANVVTFDEVRATVVSSSPSELKVMVPDELSSVSSTITVLRSNTDDFPATFPSPFQLKEPELVSFTPNEGKSETIVTINGNNFHPRIEHNAVWFGDEATGSPGEILSATGTTLTVRPPNLLDTLVNITVKTLGQPVMSIDKYHHISPWRRIKSYPSARQEATAFSLGGLGYVGLGTDNGFTTAKYFYKYDPSSDSWSVSGNFNSVNSSATSSGYRDVCSWTNGTNGFVGVGDFAEFDKGTTGIFDPGNDSWTGAAHLTEETYAAISFSIDGKGYVGTGLKQFQPTTNFWVYDPGTDKWTRKGDFPGIGRSNAVSFTIGSKGYLVGGVRPEAWLNDTWEYDAATDTWITRADGPSPRLNATAFSVNGKGYIVGGLLPSSIATAEVYSFDPVANTWTKLRDFPGAAREGGVAFTIGNKAYFGTGNKDGELVKDFWEFDPSRL